MKKFDLPYISLEITSDCNLNCRYCYNTWKRPGEKTVRLNSYLKAKKVLKQLFRIADIKHVTFTGGEPFLSERFDEIVLFTRMKKKDVTLITNGNAASQKDYEMMVKLGVGLFELPLHSINPEIHDKITKVNSSWEKSLQSIKILINNGAQVVGVIVITKINFNDVPETMKFMKSIGIRNIMLNRYNYGGSGIAEADHICMTHQEIKDTYKKANEIAVDTELSVTSNVCTPFCLLNPEEYPNIGFGSCSRDVKTMPLTVDINGNLRLCNHSPVIAGNIFENDFETIFKSDYVANWNIETPLFCKDCNIYEKCLGGCRAAAEQLGHGNAAVDPIMTI